MSSADKRLDLRFGAFACSVQGFDDPVQPVQQVLRAIQHLLEESPELSDTAINFDAEAIEQLVGEVARRAELNEHEVEIVPGLIIIHHGAGGDLAAGAAAAESDSAFWQADAPETEEAERAEGGYVNIFAGGGNGADPGEAEGGHDAESEEAIEARLRRVAEAGVDHYGWDEGEEPEADRDAGQGADWREDAVPETGGQEPWQAEPEERGPVVVNFFAAAEAAEAEDPAPERNLFAESEDEEDWERLLTRQEGDAEAPGTEGEQKEREEEGYTAAGLAQRAGAESVPDLMVASAAWMVLIQGQTQFTRREVLGVFDTIPGDHEKTPEARIKGFGKAVRNGHLVAVSEGVYGISRADLEEFQRLL